MSFRASSPNKTAKSPVKKRKAQVAPEDNWNLVANPDIYLDKLPQPYRFLNECLDDLIMKPVFNEITSIEERKKTPEYEGNIKEIMATGRLDNTDGVTCIAKMEPLTLAGGLSEKTNSPGNAHYSSNYGLHNLIVTGDKTGSISLMDVSKKTCFDTKKIEAYKGRRIVSISSCCLEWLDTTLIYIAVVARASPIVSILVCK